MNILYSGDANIADGVLLSTLSLCKLYTKPIHIYILTAAVEHNGERREALGKDFTCFLEEQMKKYNGCHTVRLIDISDKFEQEKPGANMDTRFTPCCMLRLYADEVDELPDKILYLDNDVICVRDPCLFYHQNMNGCSIAGVLDYYGSWFFRQKPWRRDYLNSGVLLLDLARIRKNGLFKSCRAMCQSKKMFMPDQSALNKLCKDKKICDRIYNEQRMLRSDTVFQHFTTSFRFFPYFHSVTVKPWDIEGMHGTLKLHAHDELIEEFLKVKQIYKKQGDIKYEQTK